MSSLETMEKERKVEVRAVLSFVIVLAILVGTLGLIVLLFISRPQAEEDEPERVIPAVEVMAVELGSHEVRIGTQGVVASRRETRLAAEISGRVLEISPNLKTGLMVREGELLVRIDAADYRAGLARARSALAEVELALAQEEARHEQARLDWERLGRGGAGNPLVLREPQLEAARAGAESARAEVERAARDVERTEIRAPFDAAVRVAQVETGAVAAPGQMVAELYSPADLEVRLPLRLQDFGFLPRGSGGEPAGIVALEGVIGGETFAWSAEVVGLDREIDRRTLTGHLIVKVEPRGEGAYPLPPVGLFVQAEIRGTKLDGVAVLPRRAIGEGGEVLVVDGAERIEFRKVKIAWSEGESVIVSEGLEEGERICLTRIGAPVSGMEVRVEETVPGKAPEDNR